MVPSILGALKTTGSLLRSIKSHPLGAGESTEMQAGRVDKDYLRLPGVSLLLTTEGGLH